MANRKRDSEGKFASKGMTGPLRDNPWTSAAIAAGAAGIGAFLWSKRGQIGEALDSGMDRMSEMKAQRWGSGEESREQSDIAEEAMTLKETGRRTKGSRGPIAQQDIKAGFAESNQEAKAGAKAYS
jgi:hypothetical protein